MQEHQERPDDSGETSGSEDDVGLRAAHAPCGQSGRGVRDAVQCQILLTFSADGPLAPLTTSNVTRSPSFRDLNPCPWMAE